MKSGNHIISSKIFKMSIAKKLILVFSIGMMIVMILTGVFLYTSELALNKEAIKANTVQVQNEINHSIHNYLDKYVQAIDTTSDMRVLKEHRESESEKDEEIYENLNIFAKNFDGILAYYFSDTGGKTYMAPNPELPKDFDARKRPWFIETKAADKLVVGNPYQDVLTGQMVITISKPIKNEAGSFVGVVATDITISSIVEEIRSAKVGKYGIVYLVDSEHKLICDNPEPEVVEEFSTPEVISILSENQVEFKEYSFQGQKKYMMALPVKNTSWKIVSTIPESEFVDGINILARRFVIITLITLFVFNILVYLLNKRIIVDPIQKILRSFSVNATGKISLKPIELSQKDELKELSEGLNKFAKQIREMVQNIEFTSKEVGHTSMKLQDNADESLKHTNVITDAMTKLAQATSEQAHSTQNGLSRVVELGEMIQLNTELARSVTKSSLEVKDMVMSGMEIIEELSDTSLSSQNAIHEIYEIVKSTQQKSKEINSANDVIKSISEQTNLLALNASIEAAKAGDAGKGFSVVAQEVRKLAEESSKSAESINDVVEQLVKNAAYAVIKMQEVLKIVDKQQNDVVEMSNKYNNINHSIENADEAVKNVEASIRNMQNAKKEIIQVLESLASLAEENALHSEHTASSAQRQNEKISELSEITATLLDMANSLNSDIEKFKL